MNKSCFPSCGNTTKNMKDGKREEKKATGQKQGSKQQD